MLSDTEIFECIEEGAIKIVPFVRENVGPCSVDLTLSSKFRVFKPGSIVDPRSPESIRENTLYVDTKNKPFTLAPNQFVLACTREKVFISKKISATLEGRSSIARLGVVVHAAGLINPGTKNSTLTLEVFCMNNSPVVLYPGMKIVQIIFTKMDRAASIGYDDRLTSKYIGQTGPEVPKFN
jgi:dCTP deaminase